MNNFKNRPFQIPEYSDSESNIISRTTYTAAIGMFLLGLVFIITAALVAPTLLKRAAILTGVFTFTAIGILILLRNQKLELANILLISVMWLTITIGAITAGGVSAPIFTGYLVVILVSGMISNQKVSGFTSLACLIAGTLILLAENNGLLTNSIQYTSSARLIIYLFFFVFTFLFQNVNTGNMQRLLKQTLRSQTQYKSLLENIPTTTYINSIDENANTEYVSPQVEKLLGYQRELFLTDSVFWQKILHPEDQERVLNANRHGTITGEPFNLEYRIVAKDQRTVWVKDEAILVKDGKGIPQYWLGVWTDITERKEAEEEQAELVSVMTKRTIQLQTAADVSQVKTKKNK